MNIGPTITANMLSYYLTDPLLANWLDGGWPIAPLGVGVAYLLILFLLKQWMDKREAIKPKTPLILWNTCLAVFSIIAFVKFAPSAVLTGLAKGGFIYSVCLVKPFSTETLVFWMSMFIISKFIEFGDTIFLVLRKAPLTFLHVYHHLTVAIYGWFGGTDRSLLGHWFLSMNFGVHSIMYTYFMLKGFGVNVPSVVAKAITSLQLLQFLMGLLVILISGVHIWYGYECNSTMACTVFGLVIYGSYLLLFSNFFYHRYIKSKPKKEN